MSRTNRTLIILTPGFPENEADTVCLPLQQAFIKALKETDPGLDIIVLSFHYPYVKKKYNWFDIRVIAFGGKNKGGWAGWQRRRKVNAAGESKA